MGPVPWSVLVDTALYGDGGFYASGGGAGRARDFLTSPEVGPLFGAVVANALDETWEALGRPDPWIVVEGGAGTGALAAAVLAAAPACAGALRYVAVELSPALRAATAGRLALEAPEQVLGPRAAPAPGEEDHPPDRRPGVGPLVTAVGELPAGTFTGVVLANELLDNLPFDVYARASRHWWEVRVGFSGGAFAEVVVPAAADVAAHLDALAPDAPDGGRVPWQPAAAAWLRQALAMLERGTVIVVDYARTTPELARVASASWLRTYRRGGPGVDPLERVGDQDITADVAVDQLALLRPPTRTSSQAPWLAAHGLDRLEADAARRWREGAASGGLEALVARSRVSEAAALRDPSGLGGFTVLEWDVGVVGVVR